MSFDELNVVRISKELKAMYERLLEFNREEYGLIAEEAHAYALYLLTDEEKKKEATKKFERDSYVEYVITHYNILTGYLYRQEAERKRLRQGEEMATAREFGDRSRYRKTLERSANLWFTQSLIYAIDIEDFIVLDTFMNGGIEEVQWIAEDDKKTCSKCRALDGKIYPINKVPPKQHYNCRCHIVPYKDVKDFV